MVLKITLRPSFARQTRRITKTSLKAFLVPHSSSNSRPYLKKLRMPVLSRLKQVKSPIFILLQLKRRRSVNIKLK